MPEDTRVRAKEADAPEVSAEMPARKQSVARALAKLLVKIGVIAAIVAVLVTVVGGVFICHTNDMYPSLRDGDLAITFRLGEYRTGDIVAYEQGDNTLFGRIVGEPGDIVNIDTDGNYTINGIAPYETIYYKTALRESDTMIFPYTIREGEYFILADAREDGLDSRNIGPVTTLKGKVVLQLRRRGF